MAVARIGVPALPTNRHDRAALGVIATYLHELTEHGRPREQVATITEPATLPAWSCWTAATTRHLHRLRRISAQPFSPRTPRRSATSPRARAASRPARRRR